MLFKKPDGEKFNIEGTLYKEAKMKMIIDGYTGTLLVGHIFSCPPRVVHISSYVS
jgi:hypothetical protein